MDATIYMYLLIMEFCTKETSLWTNKHENVAISFAYTWKLRDIMIVHK